MKNLFLFIENKLVKPMEKISTQRHIAAIRNAMFAVFPLSLIGSLFYFVATLPFPEGSALQLFLAKHANTILIPYRMTVVLITLYVIVGVGANLAKHYRYSQTSGVIMAMVAFLMTIVPINPSSMVPQVFLDSAANSKLDISWYANLQDIGWVIPQTRMSGLYIYVGIISAILGVEAMRLSKWIHNKRKRGHAGKKAKLPKPLEQVLAGLMPTFIVVMVFFIVRDIIGFDLQRVVSFILDSLITSSKTLGGAMLYVLVISLFTFLGIVGYSVPGSAASKSWASLLMANSLMHSSGSVPNNISTLPFFHYFVWIGGAGATLSLVVLMCFSKSNRLKKIGIGCLIPSITNLNQPVIYGVPVILNPFMLIPTIVAPQLATLFTYICMNANIVGRTFTDHSKSLPFFIGALLSTNDWKAMILSILNFVICIVVYYPFFKLYEKKMLAEGDTRAKNYTLKKDGKLKTTSVE